MDKFKNEIYKLEVLVQVNGGIAEIITNTKEITVFLIDYDNEDCNLEELNCYTKDFATILKEIKESNNE